MCRVTALALAFAAAGGVLEGHAQGVRGRSAPTRALAARAESLWAGLGRRDSLRKLEQNQQRHGRVFVTGDVAVVVPASVGEITGSRMAQGAAAYLAELGAIPSPFVASRVVVAYAATAVDSAVRASGLRGRVRRMADISAAPDTLADGLLVANAIAWDYREVLDSAWKAWLPLDLTLGWTLAREGTAAVRELLQGETRVGAKCLEGEPAQCRLWLGLDRVDDPYAARYQPSELRRVLAREPFYGGRAGGRIAECLAGSDAACLKVGHFYAAPIPAGSLPRGSLLREVRAVHGTAALRRALSDTAGAVGQRLARATLISEDSLMAEWRAWLLTGGGHPRVAADVRAAFPAVAFTGLLLLAAAASGRWR